MNENLNLTQVLKGCPKGTKLYSTIYGEVEFIRIDNKSIDYPIDFNTFDGYTISLTSDGRCNKSYDGECTLFPSKDQRDWSKWHRPFVDGDIIADKDGFGKITKEECITVETTLIEDIELIKWLAEEEGEAFDMLTQ